MNGMKILLDTRRVIGNKMLYNVKIYLYKLLNKVQELILLNDR